QNVDSSSTKTSNVTSSSETQKKNTSSKAITSKTTTSKKSTSQKANSSKKTTSNKNTSSSKKSSSSKKTTSSKNSSSKSVSSKKTTVEKWTGDVTDLDPSWKCPDPSAHSGRHCLNTLDHERAIKVCKEEQARYEKWAKKWGFTDVEKFKKWMDTHCRNCGKVLGDGHNGTCLQGLKDGYLVCHHYD
ncbi:MAG: hypothetical protein J5852_00365, partial [Clostridia bacterium]|nr:hypothetical protein [Clostridia bacterium]